MTSLTNVTLLLPGSRFTSKETVLPTEVDVEAGESVILVAFKALLRVSVFWFDVWVISQTVSGIAARRIKIKPKTRNFFPEKDIQYNPLTTDLFYSGKNR